MNTSLHPSRTPSRLSDSIYHQLNSYALAATAAGVAVLALAQPADAKIVYTPAHKIIPKCRYPTLCYNLDLNHDHIIDFTIPLQTSSKSFLLFIRPAKNKSKNQVWGGLLYSNGGDTNGSFAASALPSGVSIGPNSFKFQPNHQVMWGFADACGESSAGCTFGEWKDVKNKYLGLKFYVKGKVHYGWARLSTTPATKLTGYAYETIPNKAIITGKTKGPDVITVEPASLGHLARGASAVSAWRVKRTAATTH
jgi:hypothetical protein